MGCSSNPQVENKNNGIEDYDERDNFYYFHIQRKNKKPLPPSKYSPEKDYNFDRNDERIGTINDEENKNSKINDDSQNDDDTSEKRNKGDLYRNKNNNGSNGDVGEDSINGKKNGPNKKSKNKNDNKDGNEEDFDEKNKKIKGNKINRIIRKNRNKNGDNDNDSYDSDDDDGEGNEDEDDYSNENMDNYKDLFSEKGKKIPKYKLNGKETEEEEKNKNLKKSKINGITIVQNLKDYFPEDITKEEIKNLVFEAFGDSIVDDMSLYIPGQTVTFEQAIELSNYIYNIVKNKQNNNEQCLEDLNVKIDLVPLNKKLIREKMFKGQDPSEKQIENVFQSYGGESNNIKVLTIEFQ